MLKWRVETRAVGVICPIVGFRQGAISHCVPVDTAARLHRSGCSMYTWACVRIARWSVLVEIARMSTKSGSASTSVLESNHKQITINST